MVSHIFLGAVYFSLFYVTVMSPDDDCFLFLIMEQTVTSQPPEVWDGGVGFVLKEMIQTHLPAPAPDIQVIT